MKTARHVQSTLPDITRPAAIAGHGRYHCPIDPSLGVVTEDDVFECETCGGVGTLPHPHYAGRVPCSDCRGSGLLIGYRSNGESYTPLPATSLDPLIERLVANIRPEPVRGCWLWTGTRINSGYGQFFMNGRREVAHRATYTLLVGEIPHELCVLHTCDVRLCVNPDHLWLGTPEENIADRVRKGRNGDTSGTNSGQAKLLPDEVRAIRASSDSVRAVAKRFGVGQTQVRRIRSGENWAHLT